MNSISRLAVITILGIAIFACGTSETVDPPRLDKKLQSELATWLEEYGKPPAEYVIGLFADHDVVFLGEQHRVKHDVRFVQSILAPLQNAGVHVLATEFGRREDQPLIDSLVAASVWDEELAREIIFHQFTMWGYQEYLDVYKAAWVLNQKLPPGSAPIRILGLNDSPDWSLIKTQEDRENPEIKRKVWKGGGERLWAETILEAVGEGEKVLVHCGIHHAFTEYRQPMVDNGEFRGFPQSLRCGNHVFNALGKRAVTVYLHAPWCGAEGYESDMRHPADGIIDALMLAKGPYPVGFNLDEGPFGGLRIKDAVYRHGYEDFKLSDFCDGWIYTKPISEYEGVTPIPGWISEKNLDYARAQCPNPYYRNSSADEFNEALSRSADINRWWGHLH